MKYRKTNSLLRAFKEDRKGTMAITYAVSLLTIVVSVGAALDVTKVSQAKHKAQSIADLAALSAAVHVKDNNGLPPLIESEGFLNGKSYPISELGFDITHSSGLNGAEPTFRIDYDMIDRTATATVEGKSANSFMQVIGRSSEVFKSQAVSIFQEVDLQNPVSLTFVLDNSGSMNWEDRPTIRNQDTNQWEKQEGAQPRLDGLKLSLSNLMDFVDDRLGNQDEAEKRVLRTGMLTYSSGTLKHRTVEMDWQVLPQDKIDDMEGWGGTNSSPPLNEAAQWLQKEDVVHLTENGQTPEKFLVFMTDGVNNGSGSTWEAKDGTGQWLGEVCKRQNQYGTCTEWKEDTREEPERPTYGRNWEEGYWVSNNSIDSLKHCEAMKRDGVRIYTIGYALEEGWYDTYHETKWGNYHFYNDNLNRLKVYDFLSGCASEPSTFLTAENADELQDAMRAIGLDIVTEVIRLKS